MINQFQTLDCQLADEFDPRKKIVVNSREEKDEYLLPKLCKQIEFYMGDANLLHDKYFKDLLFQNNNWIPLESFLKCNKIKTIMHNYPKGHNQQIHILEYALKRSNILEVNEEKHFVKRKIPFKADPKYMDERTIYIENLPRQIDIKMLYSIFLHVKNCQLTTRLITIFSNQKNLTLMLLLLF